MNVKILLYGIVKHEYRIIFIRFQICVYTIISSFGCSVKQSLSKLSIFICKFYKYMITLSNDY